ncbi:hypothetical protein ACFL0P_03635 [Candidatus Omnitrophota bacterium]
MAKEFLDGAGWGFIFSHPFFAAEGGSTVVSYLASLFFIIFGDNFFSLTLAPIVFTLLISIVFYLFLSRYFSLRTAIFFFFLFIFSPSPFYAFSLHALGFHYEVILFSILGLFCFSGIFFNKTRYETYMTGKSHNRKLALHFIIFGLVSGFGTYFFYTYLIMLFTLMIFWFIFDKKFFLKIYFYQFLFGLLIGFSPWLIYNSSHNFAGLIIHNFSLREIIFSKTLPQIVQTLVVIGTDYLPKHLGRELYNTIILSFVLMCMLNVKTIRQILRNKILPSDMKELIFISYVVIFIATWSILYMPVSSGATPWLDGLWGRLFHICPFLFALMALFFNRLTASRKNRAYLLRNGLSIALVVWILYIGFTNYSNLLTTPDLKINPLRIKGYSAKMAYAMDIKAPKGFLGRDILRSLKVVRSEGAQLGQIFDYESYYHTLFSNNPLLQELSSYPQLNEAKKAHCFVLIGLNTGDFIEGYEVSDLNRLIEQKVPLRYRHHVYEGISISLMNRRYKELLENIDFINDIPLEYGHYFLLGLGRVIEEHFEDREREEKLQYVMDRFSPASKEYLYRGLVRSLVDDKFLKDYKGPNVEEAYLPYLYREMAIKIYGDLPTQEEVSYRLEDLSINKENKKYLYYGIIGAFFKNDTVYDEIKVEEKIEKVVAIKWMERNYLCEGLGLVLGHLTSGYMEEFADFVKSLLDNKELVYFYQGYDLSLKERYGRDFKRIEEMLNNNVPQEFRKNIL